MSVMPIVMWPDPRLSKVCAPVADPSALRGLVTDMFDTMYAAPGRGLAGPQIGVMQRVFVMDPGWKDGSPQPWVCINPSATPLDDDEIEITEACLSIPGISTPITRAARIRLTYTDLDGDQHSADLDGAAARCALHELDHLDGKVTFDRLDADARARAEAEYAAQ